MIIDASIAVKWFLNEESSDLADQLLGGNCLLQAPQLLRLEVSAAIAKEVRMGNLVEDDAKTLNELWHTHLDNSLVLLENTKSLEQEAFRVATKYRHALQDCLYVALAHKTKQPLLSKDKKQLAVAQEHGVEIVSLEDAIKL